MQGERVTVEIGGGVAEVTLNRADKLNALDPAMFEAIIAVGESLGRTAGLSCSLAPSKAFAPGSTRKHSHRSRPEAQRRRSAISRSARMGSPMRFNRRRMSGVPVIAAIHGVALGGGFQIALGADIRYVAPDARLAIMEIKWGLIPDMGGIALMRELARSDAIRELAMTGRIFSGAEAFAYGFATSLHADPRAAARATAKEIAARSPDAVRAAKRLLNAASDSDAAAILLAESKEQAALIGSPNQVEAVRAGVEGRPGRFADGE
jgi:enoyl-CoA hydratase/carnithine racemase